jgi:hypothetical protein
MLYGMSHRLHVVVVVVVDLHKVLQRERVGVYYGNTKVRYVTDGMGGRRQLLGRSETFHPFIDEPCCEGEEGTRRCACDSSRAPP